MNILVLATFVVCFAGIWGAYWFFVIRPEEREAGFVRRRLRSGKRAQVLQDPRLRKQVQAMSAVKSFDAVLRRAESQTGSLQTLIDQSGASVNVGTVVLASGTLGLLVFVLVQRFTSALVVAGDLAGFLALLLAAGAGMLAAMVPIGVLRFMRTRRMLKFEEQFPEALDLLARAMRAGHAFTTGIEMVANELPKPVGPEFRLLHDQQNYGMPMADALKTFADRIPVLDARFFVTAVLIQRESGGNLAEVLDNLTRVIRERFRVKRQMRVISAHGRITGWILVALPPVLGIVLMAANPEHRRTMFGDPLGIQMIVGAIVLQIIGTLIIRKIINVEY